MRAGRGFAAAMVAGLILVGCAEPPPELRTVQGECAEVYGGNICTWATLGAGDSLVAFGATVPVASAEGAPADMEMTWPPTVAAVIRLPAEVTAATGADHLTVYWEPHGHPPGAYLTPHFDFHFYTIPNAVREGIDCADVTKPPAIPSGYALPDEEIPGIGTLVGICVPGMGMHSLPAAELESDQIFDGTMVIGYYRGGPIFFEPMIARHHLAKRASFEVPMPQVDGIPDGVHFPRQFRAEYDAAADAYRFTFSGH